ncbi:cytochrome P450 [Falsiroseomonas ponticola]|uniref:cytochrome P450 n=1 Tax=Falsiroseomonas ponticola TaxID=2786951 RepID=UPI0019326B40|nr:cytochrome P450 [Roseomonas ponticola]
MTIAGSQPAPPAALPDVPALEGGGPLGHLRAMAAAPHSFPAAALQAHGGIVGIRLGPRRIVAIGRPDLAREVLVTRADRYPRGRINRNLGAVIGEGLLATEGDLWRARRRRMQPSFRADRLGDLAATTAAVMAETMDRWAGDPIDAGQEAGRIAIGVIGGVLLSRRIGEGEGAAFVAAVQDCLAQLMRRNWSFIRWPLWVPVPVNRAVNATRRTLEAFLGRELDRRLAAPDAQPDDLLAALIRGRPDDAPLPRQALLDELKTLFAAGFETTATALTWLMHLLARHPGVAQALRDEALPVLGDRAPTPADLPRLPYAAAVVEEAMRLYPPVYNMGRDCAADDDLGGFRIRAGTTVLVSIFAIHRSPALWEAPEDFRPDRFLGAGAAARRNLLPYAWGRHQCIGNHFADLELVVAMLALVRRWRLEPVEEAPIGLRGRTTLAPDRPLMLRPVPLA